MLLLPPNPCSTVYPLSRSHIEVAPWSMAYSHDGYWLLCKILYDSSPRPLSDRALLIQEVPMNPVISEYFGRTVPSSSLFSRATVAARFLTIDRKSTRLNS